MLIPLIAIIAAISGTAAMTLLGDLLLHVGAIKGEIARKFVHIGSGLWIAFWPSFLVSRWEIVVAGLILLLGVWITKQYKRTQRFLSRIEKRRGPLGNLAHKFTNTLRWLRSNFGFFAAIHNVMRRTSGELWFAAVIIGLPLIFASPLIFRMAILHMTLADGLAALIGSKFGGNNRYQVFGVTKSKVGSLTFWLVSFVLLLIFFGITQSVLFASFDHTIVTVGITALLAAGFTIIEAVSVHGLDNLTVPFGVALALALMVR